MGDAVTQGSSDQIELLLVESGPWVVGIDSRTVLWVERPGRRDNSDRSSSSNGETLSLAHLLGSQSRGTKRNHRVLSLAPTGAQRIEVDRVVEARAAALADMRATPAFLHHMGIPQWVLGFLVLEDGELVVLLEPSEAVGQRGTESQHETDDPQA